MKTYMEKGAMSLTTCCEFLGCLRRGMRSGSKSGGKYLLRTANKRQTYLHTTYLWANTDLFVQTWWEEVKSGCLYLKRSAFLPNTTATTAVRRQYCLGVIMALKFWKPGAAGPGSALDRASELEGNFIPSAPLYASLSIQNQRERLPIFKHRESALWISSSWTVYSIAVCRIKSALLYRKVWSYYSCGADGVREDYA